MAFLADTAAAWVTGTKPAEAVVDRESLIRLERARRLLKDGRTEPALVLLQSLLDAPQDWHFPKQGEPGKIRSLKDEADAVIAALPPAAKRFYELKYGVEASVRLKRAVRLQDWEELEEIAASYFNTAAGKQAAYRLGVAALNRGESLAAVRRFDRLRSSSAAEEFEPRLSLLTAVARAKLTHDEPAREALQKFRKATGDHVTLGENQVTMFAPWRDPLTWLTKSLGTTRAEPLAPTQNWPMFRGDPARNAVSPNASLLWKTAWRHSTVIEKDAADGKQFRKLNAVIERLAQKHRAPSSEVQPLPMAHPLVVNGMVVCRTLKDVRAVDLKTGRMRWRSHVMDSDFPKRMAAAANVADEPMRQYLEQRLWRDLTFGTLSADDRRVFALDDLGVWDIGGEEPPRMSSFNRLKAVDVNNGRTLWEAGGPENSGLPLAGAFFLGPPVVWKDQIAVLAETGGEIQLLMLNPVVGKLLWRQPLAIPSMPVGMHPRRRFAGLSPTYRAGIMVCPTTAGTVVAVDYVRRRLLWKFDYRSTPRYHIASVAEYDRKRRWNDSSPTIADGRVLITPRDSHDIVCLNLEDGTVQWRQRVYDGLYVAGIHEGNVVLVERTAVRGLRLSDGKPAWDQPLSISYPGGRGCRTAGRYHLPLMSGEIITIEMASGRVLASSESPDLQSAGNLVSAGGRVVCQTENAVVAFASLEETDRDWRQRFATRPDEPAALAERGEQRLHLGNEEGLTDLRASLAQTPTPNARRALVTALLGGLRHEFAKYQSSTEEIARWIDGPAQGEEFFQLHVKGLEDTGQFARAFEEYVRRGEVDARNPQIKERAYGWQARSDRRLRRQLDGLYSRVNGPHSRVPFSRRKQLDRAISSYQNKVLAQKSPAALRRFLYGLPHHSSTRYMRQELVKLLEAERHSLELEWRLLEQMPSRDRFTEGRALARLAELLLEKKNVRDARPLVDDLAKRFTWQECVRGKTGLQLAKEWRANEAYAAVLNSPPPKPNSPPQAADTAQEKGALTVKQHKGPFFRNWRFSIDAEHRRLVAKDATGRQQFQVILSPKPMPIRRTNILIRGHLVVVSTRDSLAVVDAQTMTPKLLWRQTWTEGVVNPFQTAVLCTHCLSYLANDFIIGVDPFTGDTLWRKDCGNQIMQLTGDEDIVIGMDAGVYSAQIYSAADGKLLRNANPSTDKDVIRLTGSR